MENFKSSFKHDMFIDFFTTPGIFLFPNSNAHILILMIKSYLMYVNKELLQINIGANLHKA